MSEKPGLYITRSRETFPASQLARLEEVFSLSFWSENSPVPPQELKERLRGKEALFCLLTDKVDSSVLPRAEEDKLKVVATMSVGYDHLDVSELKSRDIRVGYTPRVLTAATAELTVSLLLATSRRLLEGNRALREGEWPAWSPFWLCGPGLAGSTVGIIGLGAIGQAVMARLKPFGVTKFLYCGRNKKEDEVEDGAEFVPRQQLLEESDFVIVTCSYSQDMKHMLDMEAFKAMKKTSILVNTSRGGIINQAHLYTALKEGEIAGAGLDVMTPEPLPVSDPLTELENCVLIPHLGSATLQTRNKMVEMTVENILFGFSGGVMPAEL